MRGRGMREGEATTTTVDRGRHVPGRQARVRCWRLAAGLAVSVAAWTAAANPPEEPEVVPASSPTFERAPALREAWHPGKPEIDWGQGLLGQLLPEQRDWLDDHGVALFGWYMLALQGNPVGGIDSDFSYTGLFDFGLDLDLDTLFGREGLFVHASGSWASGTDLSDAVGSFAPVNAVFSGDVARLFELYIEQQLFEDTLSLRIGRLSVGWEYGLEYDYFTHLLSAAFRLNVFALDANDPNFSVIPFANWGTRLRWTPNESWRFQASFMNGFPRDFADDRYHGANFDFRPGDGAFFIAEGSYQWAATATQRKEKPGRLPGRLTMGGYYDTGEFDVVDGSGRTAENLFSIYTIFRQKLWEPESLSDRGLNVWTSFAFSGRREIVSAPYFWSGGVHWTGPLASRESDVVSFGFATSWLSKFLAGSGAYETVLETTYDMEVTSWLSLMADFQYIVRPGGTGTIDDAFVTGLLFYFTF